MSYADTNDRDIRAKQESSPAASAAFPHQTPANGESDDQVDVDQVDVDAVDPDDVKVLPGTGGPDDVGDVEVDPDELNMSGH
jgi:hypothetical protein